MIRFAVVADNHLYVDSPDDGRPPRLQTQGPRVLDLLVAELNSLSLDFIVHVGDVLCGGENFGCSDALFRKSLDHAAATFSRLDAPLHVVPGNHDCDVATGRFDDFAARWPVPAPLAVVDVAPRLRLALAHVYGDSVYDCRTGVWCDTLDARLRHEAARAAGDGCAMILAVHTWLLEHTYTDCADEPSKGTPLDVERMRQTVRESPALAMALTGHRHRNRINAFDGAAVIDTASLVAYPFGYRVITLHDDGRMVGTYHQLPFPEVIEASRQLSDDAFNRQLLGENADRDVDMVLPRLRDAWA